MWITRLIYFVPKDLAMKENDYLCPRCKGHLNAGNKVVFSTKNTRGSKGLILLNPTIGGYSYDHHKAYNLVKGELIDFNCPICGKDLKSLKNQSYVAIDMIDHNNKQYEVLFSRVVGDKSTYVIASDNAIEQFGEDAIDFEDLFGVFD